jgi:8-oxo-dGTP pyrophosphatase MutT (NUDIX family)
MLKDVQMYKIFVNDKPVYFSSHDDLGLLFSQSNEIKNFPLFEHVNDLAAIQSALGLLSSTSVNGVIFSANNVKTLKELFFSNFKLVVAAGGVVQNENHHLLMIYRRGKWDLPKGKQDKGETIDETALREVNEETGVADLKIVNKISLYAWQQPCTYHCYTEREKRLIKATHWFEMRCPDQALVPQAEENIEMAVWADAKSLQFMETNTFGAIRDVLAAGVHAVI